VWNVGGDAGRRGFKSRGGKKGDAIVG